MTDGSGSFTSDVLPLFELHRAAWLERARATARFLARQNGRVTIDDVRAECPPPEGVDPRCMGAVLRHRDFVLVEYAASGRRECHHRPIAVFKLVEAA